MENRSQRMNAPLLPSSRKQFWEAICTLPEFLVETSLLSPKAEDTPPSLLLLPLLCSPASWGHPQVLNSGSALKGSQNKAAAVLKIWLHPQLGISWIWYTREGGSPIKKVFTATGMYFMDKPNVQWGWIGTHSFIRPTAGKAPSLCCYSPVDIVTRTWMGHWKGLCLILKSSKWFCSFVGKTVPFSDEEIRTCPREGQTTHRCCSRDQSRSLQIHLSVLEPMFGAQGFDRRKVCLGITWPML